MVQNLFVLLLLSPKVVLLLLLLCLQDSNAMTVENFRPVKGLSRIYRCAKTESLANVMSPQSVAECVILNQTGLIIDLRSTVERDDAQAQLWMDRFGFEALDVVTAGGNVSPPPPRRSMTKRVLRIDVQPRERMFDYMTKSWLTPAQKTMAPMLALFDPNSLHEQQLEALNERGLAGLNEAILESGGTDLCRALKEMTTHLENFDTSIVIHCVQGKDRYVGFEIKAVVLGDSLFLIFPSLLLVAEQGCCRCCASLSLGSPIRRSLMSTFSLTYTCETILLSH
jgi:hypothetical protein